MGFVGDSVDDAKLYDYVRKLPVGSMLLHTGRGIGAQLRPMVSGKDKRGGLLMSELVVTGGFMIKRPRKSVNTTKPGHDMIRILRSLQACGADAWVVLGVNPDKPAVSDAITRAARQARDAGVTVKRMKAAP